MVLNRSHSHLIISSSMCIPKYLNSLNITWASSERIGVGGQKRYSGPAISTIIDLEVKILNFKMLKPFVD